MSELTPSKLMLSIGQTIMRQLKLGNVLSGSIASMVLITVPCLGLYYKTGYVFFALFALLPFLYFIRVYDFFMKNNPAFLRSEEHTERMSRIAAGMGKKGHEVSEDVLLALPPVPNNPSKQIEGDGK